MQSKCIGNQSAKTTLVFLHGWCCLPDSFRLQVDYFKVHYQILLINYSDFLIQNHVPRQDLFMFCVKAVEKEILNYSDNNIVLIGHSMGGVMALPIALRLRDRIKGAVLIDFAIEPPENEVGKYDQLIEEMKGENGADILAEGIRTHMINPKFDCLDLMDQQLLSMISTWQKAPNQFGQLLADACHFNKVVAIERLLCPIMYIAGTPGFVDLNYLKQLNLKVQIEQLPSGHFVMLNQTDRVNGLIERFAKDSLGV